MWKMKKHVCFRYLFVFFLKKKEKKQISDPFPRKSHHFPTPPYSPI